MSLAMQLQRLQGAARRRQIAIVVVLGAPWLLLALWLALAASGGLVRLLPVAALALMVEVARRASLAIDSQWMARRLDAQQRGLEDSAALLFASPAALSALAGVQRQRISARLQSQLRPDLRPGWPLRAVLFNTLAAIAIALGLWVWQQDIAPAASAVGPAKVTVDPGAAVAHIVEQRLTIQPPAYTGLPMRQQASLQARVAEGSLLSWSLRTSAPVTGVQLVFHDRTRLPLQRQGQDWVGRRELRGSTLYRIELGDEPPAKGQALQRIDVIRDRPPQIRVIEPDRNLTVLENKQAIWPIRFEASDDFGLGAAMLRITLAQGSGENIKVSARNLELSGQGDARRRSYRRQLDLASLGFASGDDLVVRLSVSDRRAPGPQTTHSASFILRWPPELGAQATGIDGLVKRTLPAYFRSQRQIIIDSEALLARRSKQSAEAFLGHSDQIGVDQRILRLRYGQFLGEEAEGGRRAGPPASAITATGATNAAVPDEHAGERPAPPSAASDGSALVAEFGHTHDEPEAATLLDPDTRALLRLALNEMWQAEGKLRLGKPDLALPFEYRALRLIKQVQQASRIYLARVGLELPPIDPTRRLGGDRAGLASRRDGLVPAQTAAAPARELWQALDGERAGATAAELDAFESWLRSKDATLPGALDLFAEVDALRRAPDCRVCAKKLRAQLWPLLEVSAPAIGIRRAPDRAGRAYLDALQGAAEP